MGFLGSIRRWVGLGAAASMALAVFLPACARAEVSFVSSTTFSDTGNVTDFARDVAIDSNGDLVVLGVTGAQPSSEEYWLGRFDKDDLTLKSSVTIEAPDPSNPEIGRIAIDSNDNIWVVGFSSTLVNGSDVYVQKFSSALLSGIGFNLNGPGNGNDVAYDIVIDDSDGIYVGGTVERAGTGKDFWIAHYDQFLLFFSSTVYDGGSSGDDEITALHRDSAGNIYAGGKTWNGSENNTYVAKFDSNLTLLGQDSRDFGDVDEDVFSVDVGLEGRIYTAGRNLQNAFDGDGILSVWTSTVGFVNQIAVNDPAFNFFDAFFDMAIGPLGDVWTVGNVSFLNLLTTANQWVSQYNPNLVFVSSRTLSSAGSQNDLLYAVTFDENDDLRAVGSVEGDGNNNFSAIWVGTYDAETAPFSFQGAALSQSEIQWSWESVPGATSYALVTTSGGVVTPVLSESTTFFVEGGISTDTLRARSLLAYRVSGEALSNATTVYTLAAPILSVTDELVFASSLTVSWLRNGNPSTTRFEISLSTDNFVANFSTPVALGDGFTDSSTTLTSLENVTTYYLRLRAFNGDDLSTAFSPTISTWTVPFPPNAPSFLATPQTFGASTTSIQWSWSHSTPPLIDFFQVRASTGGAISGKLAANATFFIQEGLTANSTFQAVVAAFNQSDKAESAPAVAYTLGEIPQNPAFDAVDITSVTISWDGGTNPPGTRYRISQSFDNFATVFSTPISIVDNYTQTVATITTGIINETSHYFRIESLNGEGLPSGFSTIISTFTRPNIPNAPTIFDFPVSSGISTTEIHWQWDHVQPPTINGFRVLAATGGALSEDFFDGTTDFIQVGLTPDTTFSIQVEAFNVSDSSRSAASTRSTLAQPPVTLGFATGGVDISSVVVTWGTNGNPSHTRYEISASLDGFASPSISTPIPLSAGLTGGTTVITSLTGDTTYSFRIRAFNGDDVETAFANVVSTLTRPPLPNAPLISTAPATLALSSDSIRWAWTHSTPPVIDGFRVAAASGGAISGDLPPPTTFFVQTGLTPNTTFSAVVEAFNTSGPTASTATTLYTLARPPTTPAIVPGEIHVSSVGLSWSANQNPAGTRYEILQSLDDFTSPAISTAVPLSEGLTQTTTFVFGLTGDATYFWRIRAYNGNGIETDLTVSTRALTRPPTPNAPVISAIPDSVGVSTSSIRWIWTHVTPPDIAGFQVAAATGGFISDVLPSHTTDFVQTGLTANSTFTARVRSFNISDSSFSAAETRYTLALPATGTQITERFVSSVTLVWSANGNPAGTFFEVYRATQDLNFSLIVATTATTVPDVLTEESTYFYLVRSRNGDGVQSSSDVVVSTPVLGFSPLAPRGFKATARDDGTVLLEWERSASLFTARYNIYWDAGGGTIGYGSFLSTVPATTLSFVTPVLSTGTYYFGLRARSLLKDDGNTDVVSSAVISVSDPFVNWVQARLTSPGSGKRIWGNRITLEAEQSRGDPGDLESILFQYRGTNPPGQPWVSVAAANNPDRLAPYFMHWNVRGLPDGVFELRAVAKNVDGNLDPRAETQYFRIDSSLPEVKGDVSGTSILVTESVFSSKDNEVVLAQEGAERIVRVAMPRSFYASEDPTSVVIETPPLDLPDIPKALSETGIVLSLSLANGVSSFELPVSITASYRDDDEDGLIDGSLARIDRMRFYFYDPTTGGWTASVPTAVDTVNKTVTMQTSHFSTFALFSPAAASLDDVRVFPVPWVPNDGVDDNGKPFLAADTESGIIFENLTQSSRVEVYTVSGELVWENTTDNSSGKIQWDVTNLNGRDVASGGYLVVIRDTETNQSVVRKIAVIR